MSLVYENDRLQTWIFTTNLISYQCWVDFKKEEWYIVQNRRSIYTQEKLKVMLLDVSMYPTDHYQEWRKRFFVRVANIERSLSLYIIYMINNKNQDRRKTETARPK